MEEEFNEITQGDKRVDSELEELRILNASKVSPVKKIVPPLTP
jgi:hypothetical protein